MTTTAMSPVRTGSASTPVSNPAASRDDRYRTMQSALFAMGAVLMPAGLIAVGLGWYGAAHSHYAYDQFPYLLSGGLLGVCLCTIGGFLYFGAWQAKVSADQKRSMGQLADTMLVLADLISRQSLQASMPGAAAAVTDPGAVPVVAGTNGAAVHRRDCGLIAHREDLRVLTSTDTGLTPCRVCNPTLI